MFDKSKIIAEAHALFRRRLDPAFTFGACLSLAWSRAKARRERLLIEAARFAAIMGGQPGFDRRAA